MMSSSAVSTSATVHPATAASTHPTAKSAAAASSHAGEPAVALHARCTAVVNTAEGTVIVGVAALLKSGTSHTLLRLSAIRESSPCAVGRTTPRLPVGHLAI